MTLKEILNANSTVPAAFIARYIKREGWNDGKVICIDGIDGYHIRVNNVIQYGGHWYRGSFIRDTDPVRPSDADLSAGDLVPCCKYGH